MKTIKAAFEKNFVRNTMAIVLPIMFQNGITMFVSMLDNIMVGKIGTDSMTGVSVVNSLLFVWYMCVFGGLSGIIIFTTQYCGKGNQEGVRRTFRLQILLSVLLTAAGVAVFEIFGRQIVGLYLHEDGGGGSAAETMRAAMSYLSVMYIEFLPFALTQAYYMTIRAHGETFAPMKASLLAMNLNLIGNYVLIYGKCGAPALGVVGAAMATVIARFVELVYIAVWAHSHADKIPFIDGAFRSLYVPRKLIIACIRKGTPLLINEAMWSGAIAVLMQCYSIRGLSVVSALNITQTIGNTFSVAFVAMGSATAIVMGQRIGEWGEERVSELKEEALKMIILSVSICLIPSLAMLALSGVFPGIYNTTEEIRRLATGLICVYAVFMPVQAFNEANYYVIRSGGKTLITFLFDSCFSWCVTIPAAAVLVYFTAIPILPLYAAVSSTDLIKGFAGLFLVKRGIWIRDITV